MTGKIVTELGTISYSEELIAKIAGIAAGENCGIAGMNAKKASDAILQLVGGENQTRGVKVATADDGESVDIDIFVTLVYGVTLPTVAQNMISNVRYRVNEMTGVRVNKVNIHVEGIRVPEE